MNGLVRTLLYDADCTILSDLQAVGLAAAEALAALITVNIVGSLTSNKSGRKSYGK